jgi:hypothetical protein
MGCELYVSIVRNGQPKVSKTAHPPQFIFEKFLRAPRQGRNRGVAGVGASLHLQIFRRLFAPIGDDVKRDLVALA